MVRRTDRERVLRVRRALKGTPVVIVEDLSPFFQGIFHEVREAAGARNVWTKGGQIFVKVQGRVRKVERDNKLDIIAAAAAELRQDARGGRDQALTTSVSPNMRGYGTGRRNQGWVVK